MARSISRSPSHRRRRSPSPVSHRHSRRSRSPISRLQLEAELKLLEEETAKRLKETIRKNVEERLNSEEVKLETARRIEQGRKKRKLL